MKSHTFRSYDGAELRNLLINMLHLSFENSPLSNYKLLQFKYSQEMY